MQTMLNMRKDFIASHLRSQVDKLLAVLHNLEDSNEVEVDYTNETLRKVETDLRQIRKLCLN